MKADPKTEAEVVEVFKKFSEAYSKKDIDAMMKLFSSAPDVLIIGSSVGEKASGVDEIKTLIKHNYTQYEEIQIDFPKYQVSVAGSVAWVAADRINKVKRGGQYKEYQTRFTAVLEKREDGWVFSQMHHSIAD